MKKGICILTALAFALCLAGCSGGGSGSTSTTISKSSQPPQTSSSGGSPQSSGSSSPQKMAVKPEQLISQAEAAALLGEAVKNGASGENPLLLSSMCFYAAENSASMGYLQIVLIQQPPGDSGGSDSGSSSQSASASPSESSSASGQPGASSGSGESMSPKSLYEALKMMLSDPNTPVTGRLGDDAFISTQGTGILYKEYFIYIAAGAATPEAAQAVVKQACELAVQNLRRVLGE